MPTPFTGQVAITASAGQLDSGNTASNVSAFTIKAPVANAHTVYIGATGVTSSTGHALEPGNELTYGRFLLAGETSYQHRVSDFWVIGTSGDVITWLALG